MANAKNKYPSDKLGRLDLGSWIGICVLMAFLFTIAILLIAAMVDSIELKNSGLTNGPAWEWDWDAMSSEANDHNIYYCINWIVWGIFAIIGWFIWGMQSDHYLCLQENNIIGKASNGKEFDIAYSEIRSVQVKDRDDYNFIVRFLSYFIPFLGFRNTLIIRYSGGVVKYIYEYKAHSIATEIESKIQQINQQNPQPSTSSASGARR